MWIKDCRNCCIIIDLPIICTRTCQVQPAGIWKQAYLHCCQGNAFPNCLKGKVCKGPLICLQSKTGKHLQIITASLSPMHTGWNTCKLLLLSLMHTVGTEVNNGSAADLHALTEQHANNEDQFARQYACLTLVPRCIALVCQPCSQNLHDPDYEMFRSLSLLHVLPRLTGTFNSDLVL